MAFVNLSLLLGGAAVAIPIVLHLVMRRKPKVVEFPAVMFLPLWFGATFLAYRDIFPSRG